MPGWKRYFEIGRQRVSSNDTSDNREGRPKTLQVNDFFRHQEEDLRKSARDAEKAAGRVQGFDDHRSAVVPWLRTTGIVDHLRSLKKDQIRAAIALPSQGEERIMDVILSQMDEILQEAHSWCFDGPDCMLTWPCRVVLDRFQSSQVELLGRTRGFDPHKLSSTLARSFRQWKQVVAYKNRVAMSGDYFFTRNSESEAVQRPEDVIELTAQQREAWETMWRLAAQKNGDECYSGQNGLKNAVLEVCMLLICHKTDAQRYRSPLVSFCAMLRIRHATLGWMAPGDLSSYLSGIIWAVHLLIFYDCARRDRNGQGETSRLVKQWCEEYLQQTAECPLGEILRWRLLLFTTSKEEVSARQATWDESEQVLTFGDTELRMDHLPQLLVQE